MSDLPVLFRERIYLPLQAVSQRQLEKEFTRTLYNDRKVCEQCDYQMESPCDMCEQCANFGGTFKLFKHVDIEGEDYVGVPVGARRKVIKLWPDLRDIEKVDERPSTKLSFRKDFEFVWDLYDYQEEAVAELHRIGYGVLDSPPRSGKTAMFVALCVRLGLRVLILASQRDWLEQFLETFHEATNILDIEKMQGKRLCGIAEKDADFQTLEICLCTYQSFLSEGNGKKRFNWVSHRFGVCGIDEVHKASADEFAKIVNTISTKHRYGLTGTPDRKDGRYFLSEMIVGPVVHKTEVESLVPTVRFTESGFSRQYKDWNAFITALAKDTDRNQLIVDLVLFYLEKGHTIVVPVYRINQVATLVKMINAQYGKKIAVPFTGELKKEARRQTVLDMRKGKYKVLIGIRSITQTGLNIPPLSCIIEAAPISNPPQHTQECARILTPVPGKLDTIIHYIVDTNGIGLGCLRTCVIKTHKELGHRISKKNWARLSEWFKQLRNRNDAFGDGDSPVKSEHGRRPKLATSGTKRTRGLFAKERR